MRSFVNAENLTGVVHAALGGARPIARVERLRGGTKKGVYRVWVDGGAPASVVVYMWADDENFWPAASSADPSDPFAPASGLVPFLSAQRTLAGLGVRVPDVLLADDSKQFYAADLAVVEDLRLGSLQTLLAVDPDHAARILADLARTLGLMQEHRNLRYGRVDLLDIGGVALGSSCEQLVLDRALRDLAAASERVDRIHEARSRFDARLRQLAGLVTPRAEYGLVHGELGPDHVLVDEGGQAVLIDIEGLMFFDVEWEHVFLQLRFGEHYPVLSRPGLDPRRLDLYMLAMRLSLVAGPLRLLDGDFPDRHLMQAIAERNTAEALALLPSG